MHQLHHPYKYYTLLTSRHNKEIKQMTLSNYNEQFFCSHFRFTKTEKRVLIAHGTKYTFSITKRWNKDIVYKESQANTLCKIFFVSLACVVPVNKGVAVNILFLKNKDYQHKEESVCLLKNKEGALYVNWLCCLLFYASIW